MHQTNLNKAAGIDFKYNGSEKLIRGFRNTQRSFEEALTALLRKAGYNGLFALTVARTIKGGSYKKGLQLGTPDFNHRAVELRWQEGSNDDRFSIALTVPNTSDTHHFHSALETVLRIIGDEAEAGRQIKKVQVQTPKEEAKVLKHPTAERAKASKNDIELSIIKVLQNSPDFGFLSRDELGLIAEFGDPEELLRTLVAGKYLIPISDDLFQLDEQWLLKPDDPETSTQPVELGQKEGDKASISAIISAEVSPATPMPQTDLIAQLKQADEVLDKAAKYKTGLQKTEATISALEIQMKIDQNRLVKLKSERDEAKTFLSNPNIAKALELKTLIDKIAKK